MELRALDAERLSESAQAIVNGANAEQQEETMRLRRELNESLARETQLRREITGHLAEETSLREQIAAQSRELEEMRVTDEQMQRIEAEIDRMLEMKQRYENRIEELTRQIREGEIKGYKKEGEITTSSDLTEIDMRTGEQMPLKRRPGERPVKPTERGDQTDWLESLKL